MERRQHKRVESINFVTIKSPDGEDTVSNAQVARTLNLTPAGAKIEVTSSAPFSISVGRGLLLTIALGEKIITVRGRVVHEKQVGARKVIVGVFFAEILPDARQVIADFIRGEVWGRSEDSAKEE